MDIEYDCKPACVPCRISGECIGELLPNFAPVGPVPRWLSSGGWHPNREPRVPVSCGCSLPWPVVYVFGSFMKECICSEHGKVKVTESAKTNAKASARSYKNREQAGQLQIQPF